MIHTNITETVISNYMPYSAYVIMERALPEIDGLKPSQRRILYTMYKMGLLGGDDDARKKSQGIVGQTMFLHPHGDQSIYDTLVRMTTDAGVLLTPYINSKGNFGKHYSRDMQFASARYTEAKLAPIAKELFEDIHKNTVEMIDSYDGTLKEPRYLPSRFPNILTNPSLGMAVGMASSIAPFNLAEVIDATIAYIQKPSLDITAYIQAPDFPSGATILYDKAKMDDILRTGHGSFDMRATCRIEGNSLFFEELPYTTTYEAIMDKIAKLVKDGKLKEIVDIHDNYGRGTTGIEVVTKNHTNKEQLAEKLYRMTPLQSSFSCNFNFIAGGTPKVLGIKEIIREWVIFRAACIKRGAEHQLAKATERMHFLQALKTVITHTETTIQLIRETKGTANVVNALVAKLGIDPAQAEFVADLRLKQLNVDYLADRIQEIDTLEAEIAELNELLANKKAVAKLIIGQLKTIRETHGKPRLTQLVERSELDTPIVTEEPVEAYNVKVVLTADRYVKKVPLTSLRGNFTLKVKEGDRIEQTVDTTSAADILVFTDQQNVYKLKLQDMEDHKPSVLGEYLPSLLQLEGETIVYVTVTADYTGHLLIGFEDGKVAKVDMKAYETKQKRLMLKNAYADKPALFFHHSNDDTDLLAVSSINKAVVVNSRMIPVKSSKTTQGIQVMKSKNDSTVSLYQPLPAGLEEANYYRTANAGVGKYLKKGDFAAPEED